MYTRYYDGYTTRNAQPVQTAQAAPEPEVIQEEAPVSNEEAKTADTAVAALPINLPFNMKTDDLILIAVLFLIASESSDEFILPLILGYLLISNT